LNVYGKLKLQNMECIYKLTSCTFTKFTNAGTVISQTAGQYYALWLVETVFEANEVSFLSADDLIVYD
jgi:hypothetical protein